ncbi:MAG TPA: FHA domain-containing protein [Patescibacteria group bacterium]|nr:FHA domain-containing protein [Patescibacteria group bacterium]
MLDFDPRKPENVRYTINLHDETNDLDHMVELTPEEPIIIGRAKTASFSIVHSAISLIHAMVFIDHEGQIAIQDLKSTNGTRVFGLRLDNRFMDASLFSTDSLKRWSEDGSVVPEAVPIAFGPLPFLISIKSISVVQVVVENK